MKRWVTVVSVAFAVSFVLAACGGGGGAPPPPPPPAPGEASTPTTPEMPSEPGDVAGGKTVVDIRDLKFVPETVTVPSGTTVVFTNSDKVPHTIKKTSGPGEDFDSGPLSPGATYQQVFSEQGRVKIKDPDRPETELEIIVEKNQ